MNERILIIDNEPGWIKFTKLVLCDYQVDISETESEAKILFNINQYALIIISGKFLDLLIDLNRQFGLRALVATSSMNDREAIRAYRAGALDYFAKSFRPYDLEHRVRMHLPMAV